MDNFVVNTGADACWKAVITLEAGSRSHLADAAFSKRVKISGGLPWFHHGHHLSKHCGHDFAGLAHDLDFAGRLDLNPATLLNSWSGRSGLSLSCLSRGQQIGEKIHWSAQYPSRYQRLAVGCRS